MASSSIRVRDFDLRHTLECGQFFRWIRIGDVYHVHHRDSFFKVWQEGSVLRFDGVAEWFVRQFFSLDHDLDEIESEIVKDEHLRAAFDQYRGLRIIRQDSWECLASFITSVASNIPRITGNLKDIARVCGQSVAIKGVESHSFPRPGEINDEQVLRRLKLGFRARYLVHAERLVVAGILDDLIGVDYDEALEALTVIPGVARKVADCVLLYSYGHLNAFPVDTWIRKVMTEIYFKGKKTTDRRIREFAADYFGRYAGYAQQYLYIASRENWDALVTAPRKRVDTRQLVMS